MTVYFDEHEKAKSVTLTVTPAKLGGKGSSSVNRKEAGLPATIQAPTLRTSGRSHSHLHPFRWASLLRMDRARMGHEDSLAHDIG
jgi:hypothetical protein